MDLNNSECCTQICNYIKRYKALGKRIEELRDLKTVADFEHVAELNEIIKERVEIKQKAELLIWAD